MPEQEPPQLPDRLFVIAGSFQQFHNWCYEHRFSPQDRRLIYVSDVNTLRGRGREMLYKIVGLAAERRDFWEILRFLEFYEAKRWWPCPDDIRVCDCGKSLDRSKGNADA